MADRRKRGFSALPRLAAGIGVIVAGSCLLFAQGFRQTISGTVTDDSGAVLPEAAVTVRQLETGLTRATVTDTAGNYSVTSLPVGAYEVTALKEGFKQEVRRGITLVVAEEAVVNLKLQVGNVEQRVTVTADAPLVNTTLSSTSGLISEQQVKDLPLNGRSFDQLLTLNTGIANNTSNIGTGNGWTGFSVAGKRQETNRYVINGVDWVGGNATAQFITPSGASGQLLGVEAVREYNVIEHTYGAEYGKRAGGQISVVTTSGTNQLHGDVFEYLRNSVLDARNFFDQSIGAPPFKRNQFGAALGGALKKDKLFLFGNYEGFRQRLQLSNRAFVPDALARQGQLPCSIITPAPDPCSASGFATVPNLKQGMLPYANAFWPAPNGAEVLTNGLPSGTAYNYSSGLQSAGEDFGLTRFDYTVSNKDSFSANYTIDDGQRNTPQSDANFIQIEPLRSQTLSLQETHVFSTRLVNSATAGYARTAAGLVRAPAAPIPSDLLFLPGGNPGTIVIGGGATTVAPAAIAPAPGINPVHGVREYFTWADDVHFTAGRHSLSAGGWLQRIRNNNVGAAQFSAGGVSYTTLQTFLQDMPSQFNLNRNPVPLGYRSLEAAWYVQDEIKLRPNLTLRLGLRDEMTDGWNEATGRCSNYVFDQNFVISTNPVIGDSCLSQNNNKALWQPRVGLAWDPTGTGTWAVRAGFGIHNDLQDNLSNRTYSNPPYNAREQLTGSLLALIPLDKAAALPPTCGPGITQRCSIYAPGGVDPNLFSPTHQQWSFTVERQLVRNFMLQVGYVGSQSYHTPLSENANTAPPQVCNNPQGCVSGGTTASGNPVPAAQRVIVPMGTTYMPPGTRPNPYVGNGVTWFDQGTSSYHALNVSLLKRFSYGVTFKANYTYSKVMDLNSAILAPSGGNEPPDVFSPYNLALNRGPASYSLNQQFNANFSYQLPFGNGQRFGGNAGGWLNQLIGGWQWNGIVSAQSGFPMAPVIGFNNSGTGDGSVPDVPDWNPNFHGKVILGTPDQWFDPRAFTLPIPGTFGNAGRSELRGPGLVAIDTSLFKKFRMSERFNLQLRAEAFNILNHPNFSLANPITFDGNPASYTYSSSAGQIYQSATSSRQLQLALKLLF